MSKKEKAPSLKKVKMLELTLKERIILPGLFPPEGSKIEQIIIRSMVKEYAFSEEEKKDLGLEYHPQGVTWNPGVDDKTFSYEIDDSKEAILKQVSDMTDKAKKINQDNLSLIEKIDAL
jgi:hypothetical protein